MEKNVIKVKKDKVMSLLEQVDNSMIPDGAFNRIASRALDSENGSLIKFHTFDNDKVAKIANNMPEINRATRSLGRRNTQTTNRLMTLTMLSGTSPFQVIKQCLAQIENKRNAIKENRYKIMRERLEVERIQKNIINTEEEIDDLKKFIDQNITEEKYKEYKNELEMLEIDLVGLKIDLEEKTSGLSDSMLYIEGALKDIASFQSSYDQVRRNNNIPKDWDEKDLEEAEVLHHLRMAFLHAYRDVMAHGRLGIGTLEYLQQFGVHPSQAALDTKKFVAKIDSKIINQKRNPITGKSTDVSLNDSVELDYEEDLEKWLDEMVKKNSDKYKKVMKRIGLENLHEDWYMYTENKE